MSVLAHCPSNPHRAGVVAVGLCLTVFALVSSSGCSILRGPRDYIQYNDTQDDLVMSWRNHVWSHLAWNQRKHEFTAEPHYRSFGEGFRAGYREVADGGDGCPPPLPPRKYWSWRYSTAEGQSKSAAWFAGFPYGVAAAEEDGSGLWREIQVSESIAIQFSDEFLNAECACCPGGQHVGGPELLEPVPDPVPLTNDFDVPNRAESERVQLPLTQPPMSRETTEPDQDNEREVPLPQLFES